MSKQLKIRAHYDRQNDVTLQVSDSVKMLQTLPNGCAALVVTSPPYNVGKEYERRRPLDEYIEHQRAVIRESIRITKVGGSICWQVGNLLNGQNQIIPLDILLHPLFLEKESGLILRNRIIWHFEHGLHCSHRFSGRHETILWYTKGNDYKFNLDDVRVPQKYPGKKAYQGPNKGNFSGNPLGKNPGDVWLFPNVKGNHVEKTEHPCQFPVELPTRLILALTNKRDLVVDPFVGVGTTAVAAALTGRRVAGADNVRAYVEIARERVRKAAAGKLKFRDPRTPIHVPLPNQPLTTVPAHFRLHASNGRA